jgi:hypothetical protein
MACATLMTACRGGAAPSDEELLAAHPDGVLFDSIETRESQVGDPAPGFLRGDGKIEGHGVEVPLPDTRPDGSHLAHKWGVWMNYYLENSARVAKESAGEFRDGHREGHWTFWHRDGQKRAEGTFTHSRMTGHWDCWREDGSVDTALSGDYQDDQRVGN